MPDFILESLQGGHDDFDPISSKPKESCDIAENVEFFKSTMGERRAGCVVITLPDGITTNLLLDSVVAMIHHQPTDDEADDELWVFTVDVVP